MVGDYRIGFFIILAAFLQPNIILSGLVALAFTVLLTQILKIDKHFHIRTTIYCNAILLGLFIGYLYLLDPISCLLIFITMALNLVFCFTFDSLFSILKLPLLSLPFSIIALFIALSMKKFTAIGHANYYFHEFYPELFQHFSSNTVLFLKSLGTFFCIPDPGFGLLVAICVLVYSPLTCLFLISGFMLGLSFDKMFAFTEREYIQQHYYFNFSLIFTAVAGIFLVPSFYSVLWATFATLITVLLSTALSSLFNFAEIPVMALPFNIAGFMILRTLKSIAHYRLNLNPGATPEDSLESNRLLMRRYLAGEVGVFSPVAGEWTIQQGFNGQWTHKGNWKHALDFVIQKENRTYQNQGLDLEDYYSFGQPVYSPVNGHIVANCSHLSDNKIEEVDNQNNWGNYLIIQSSLGYFVKLSHLKKNSSKAQLGQYVVAGEEVAKCGNSGYSREPHLHMQIQYSMLVGAHTAPFHLLNCFNTKTNVAHFQHVPKTNDTMAPFVFNFSLHRALNFKIGQKSSWNIYYQEKTNQITLEHCLDSVTGKRYWFDGTSKLFYHIHGAKFYFYELEGESHSPLWDLYLSAPSIPIITGQSAKFEDELTLKLTHHYLSRLGYLTMQLLSGKMQPNTGKYQIDPSNLTIEGEVIIRNQKQKTFFKVDPIIGICEFQIGDTRYEIQ